jgi:hypothetical protein
MLVEGLVPVQDIVTTTAMVIKCVPILSRPDLVTELAGYMHRLIVLHEGQKRRKRFIAISTVLFFVYAYRLGTQHVGKLIGGSLITKSTGIVLRMQVLFQS